MCGIAGVFIRESEALPEERMLIAMRDSMVKRGPDEAGIFIDKKIGLAHRRLSIIDLSSGQQPMSSSDGRYSIVFNGEVYNYSELRNDLEKKGFKFRTNSDTETILQLYIASGERCVEKLRGMYAFAIWDKDRKQLFCVRDRLGKKPFFYHADQKCFIFASEIKALLKTPFVQKEPDLESIDLFLTFGYIPGEKTAFKEIQKLLPGHFMIVTEEKTIVKKYWELPEYSADFEASVDEETHKGKLLELFDSSVLIRLMSEVPLGAFLSGGVDSTAVVASMAKFSQAPVITTTVGFDVPEFDETAIAQQSANFYSTDHRMHKVIPNASDVILDLVRYFDEPFADASAVPTYYVCKFARQDVTVALSGDGGDELFGGYNWYDTFQKNRRYASKLGIAAPILGVCASLLKSPYKGKSFAVSLGMDDWSAILKIRSVWDQNSKVSLYNRPFLDISRNNETAKLMHEHFLNKTKGMHPVRKMQFFDFNYYLPDDILVKADRMSMINSLELRAPLLDHVLAEYSWTLPTSLKLNGGTRKYIFKKAIESTLPPGLLSYPKRGFTPPVKAWLTGPLRSLTEDTLFSIKARQRGLLNSKKLENYWKRFVSGQSIYSDSSTQVWTLLMLELWFNQCVDSQA